MEGFAGNVLLVVGIGSLISIGLLFWTRAVLRKHRQVVNLPTSACRGIAPGLTELKGEVREHAETLESTLGGRRCVAFDYQVSENQEKTGTTTDKDGKSRTETSTEWVRLISGRERVAFELCDETGGVPVFPEGADVRTIERFDEILRRGDPLYEWSMDIDSGQGRERRFTESTLESGDSVYLIGPAHFDPDSGLPFIGESEVESYFFVTSESEKSVRRGLGCGGYFLALLTAAAFAATIYLPLVFAARWAERDAGLVAGGAAVGFLLLHWFWFTYNDMIWVRELVRKAWGNIEVDLKKRANLVPRLASVVRGAASHEREVLEEIAEARAPDAASVQSAGEDLDLQTKSLARVYAVSEKYPDLKANDLFLDLMRRLARVENRLSHLRAFYNDAVLSYQDRVAQFPANLVAGLTGFPDMPQIHAADFERLPIEVRFDAPGSSR